MNIRDFIEEEVIRQGFKKDPEKAQRCLWMNNAWNYAMNIAVERKIGLDRKSTRLNSSHH